MSQFSTFLFPLISAEEWKSGLLCTMHPPPHEMSSRGGGVRCTPDHPSVSTKFYNSLKAAGVGGFLSTCFNLCSAVPPTVYVQTPVSHVCWCSELIKEIHYGPLWRGILGYIGVGWWLRVPIIILPCSADSFFNLLLIAVCRLVCSLVGSFALLLVSTTCTFSTVRTGCNSSASKGRFDSNHATILVGLCFVWVFHYSQAASLKQSVAGIVSPIARQLRLGDVFSMTPCLSEIVKLLDIIPLWY